MGLFSKIGSFAGKVGKKIVSTTKDPVGTVKKDLKRAKYDLIERPKKDFKKHAATAAGAVGGFILGGPAGAVAGGLSGAQYGSQKRSIKKAERAAKEGSLEEERLMNEARAVQAEDDRRQKSEQASLQESDAERIRSKRKRGRRSLLAEDELGVPSNGMRSTLG